MSEELKCDCCGNKHCDYVIDGDEVTCCDCKFSETGYELEEWCSSCKQEYYADIGDTIRKQALEH